MSKLILLLGVMVASGSLMGSVVASLAAHDYLDEPVLGSFFVQCVWLLAGWLVADATRNLPPDANRGTNDNGADGAFVLCLLLLALLVGVTNLIELWFGMRFTLPYGERNAYYHHAAVLVGGAAAASLVYASGRVRDNHRPGAVKIDG